MKKHLLLGILLLTLSVSSFSFAQNSQNYIESSVSFSKSLYRGLRDAQVKSLQDLLKEAGYFNDTSTGFFGVKTEAAVKKFQSDNGIDSVGLVGKKTREVLNKKYIYKSSIDSTIKNNATIDTALSNNSSVDPASYVDECNYIKGPYLKLISPNGGEVYQAGGQAQIKWKSCNISSNTKLRIVIIYNGNGGGTAYDGYLHDSANGSDIFANSGSANVTVPNATLWPSVPFTFGKYYKIKVITEGMDIQDDSDNTFTIQNNNTSVCDSTTNPWIKVLLPNGGETYQAGQQVEVKWETCNISTNEKVNLMIAHYSPSGGGIDGSNYVANLTLEGTLNDGQETIVLPTQYSGRSFGKNFKMLVVKYPYSGSGSLYDASDNLFTINQQSNITTDTTPRIAMWYGKVNQHTNSNGEWVTDPDGVSGAGNYSQWGSEGYGDRKLEYCKKFYPNTVSVADYKSETINTWRERGNTGGPHTAEVITTRCLLEIQNTTSHIEVLSPNGGEVYQAGQKVTVKWRTLDVPRNTQISLSLSTIDSPNNSIGLSNEWLVGNGNFAFENDGQEIITLPSLEFLGWQYGTKFKIKALAFAGTNFRAEDLSDNLFTINSVINTNLDTTPRIAYWWGKVNQHVDSNGNWVTDPDGTSGANLDQLTYCKKWYPNTISTQDYKRESISTWRAAGNTGSYTAEVMTVRCVAR